MNIFFNSEEVTKKHLSRNYFNCMSSHILFELKHSFFMFLPSYGPGLTGQEFWSTSSDYIKSHAVTESNDYKQQFKPQNFHRPLSEESLPAFVKLQVLLSLSADHELAAEGVSGEPVGDLNTLHHVIWHWQGKAWILLRAEAPWYAHKTNPTSPLPAASEVVYFVNFPPPRFQNSVFSLCGGKQQAEVVGGEKNPRVRKHLNACSKNPQGLQWNM